MQASLLEMLVLDLMLVFTAAIHIEIQNTPGLVYSSQSYCQQYRAGNVCQQITSTNPTSF